MKKILKALLYVFGITFSLVIASAISINIYYRILSKNNLKLALAPPQTLEFQGLKYRDLNRNEILDIYEDSRESVEKRVDDLLSQMNLEEKAGMMFVSMAGIDSEGSLQEVPSFLDPASFYTIPNSGLILNRRINHINLSDAEASLIGKWTNRIQKLAEQTRLGIPVTIATDPRHAFSTNPLAGFKSKGFSQWPEPLGFAALGDTAIVKEFATIARKEYRAVGIQLALHPMADLATEPRWPRIGGTFGEDANLASKMVYQYIKGFQGDSLSSTSVACMAKHFSGGGPQKNGFDPHFDFGKEQVYPGGNFEYHLIPFQSVFKAKSAAIMPYYSIPMNQTSENVGFSFNKEIITGLLRNKFNYDGVICTDWGIITDKKILGKKIMSPPAWGLENAQPKERILKALEAGIDQFGGEHEPALLIDLVNEGKIAESRLDESVRRLLKVKFQLGLFENPFIDENEMIDQIGTKEDVALGKKVQGKSMVLLKNQNRTLPLNKNLKIYVENLSKEIASRYAIVVDNIQDADIAIVRLDAPHQTVGEGMMATFFHHGDLDFKDETKKHILNLMSKVPTVVDIYLDRAAVIPEISEHSVGLLVNFGASDEVFLDVVFGNISPEGNLPIELPSSMEAVRNQLEDVPYDSKEPLYSFGFGLRYEQIKKLD